VTVEEFHKMNDGDKFILMGCQINKQKEQIGTQKTREWLREGEREAMKQDTEDIRPVQIDYIKEEGISCTRAEMREWEETR
jgi:hypothetical protein